MVRMFPFVLAVAQLLIIVTFGVPVKTPIAPTKAPPQHVTPIKKPVVTKPTGSPISVRAALIKAQLEKVVGAQKLTSTSTPYYKAFQWIVNTDAMKLGPYAENLVQRYLAVLLYYSTTPSGPWLSCNPPLKGQDESCLWANLVGVFPKVYDYVPWIRWLSSYPECQWAGVVCNEFDQITDFQLYGQNLSGKLPVDVIHFPYLRSLSLEWNQFRGSLPPEWSQIKNLMNIEVLYNYLTGTIPDSWWSMENLGGLNVAGNLLTGRISPLVGGLSSLQGFYTFDNLMTGPLPTELGKLKNLTYTRLHMNFHNGTLPTQIGNLVYLEEFWFYQNKISGEIPSQFGQLNQLTVLRGFDNNLKGSIPRQFYNMISLTEIELDHCKFTGTISTLIGNLQQLTLLNISNNKFSGTIPPQLGTLSQLQRVRLQSNNFHGSIPKSVCELHVQLLEADCSATNGTRAPEIYCPKGCCTVCCDHATGKCIFP